MFFSMNDVNDVIRMPLVQGKVFAKEIVVNTPNAQKRNVFKATRLIETSRTSVQLATGMSNFILAHTDNKLCVI